MLRKSWYWSDVVIRLTPCRTSVMTCLFDFWIHVSQNVNKELILVQWKENSGIQTVAFKASHFCSEWRKTRLSYFNFSKFPGGACPQTLLAGSRLRRHQLRLRRRKSHSLPTNQLESSAQNFRLNLSSSIHFTACYAPSPLGFFFFFKYHTRFEAKSVKIYTRFQNTTAKNHSYIAFIWESPSPR